MRWLLFCSFISLAFSHDFFYRPITSGSCEDVSCNDLSAGECEEAFEHMKETSRTVDSPHVRRYLEGTSTTFQPTGCVANFNLTTASLKYNEGLNTISASTDHPVYCMCDVEAEYEKREEFEDAVQWCDGWLGDIEIDPTRSWVDAGLMGTPTIAVRSLGREMEARTVGLLFQPGSGFAKSSLVSIGIHFTEIPTGVRLAASLRGCQTTTVPDGTTFECVQGAADLVFSDLELPPGKGDEDAIYFIDLHNTTLKPYWTYFLEFAYPPPLPTRNTDHYDMFWSVRLPVYHPILEIPWNYVFEDTTYFRSIKSYNAELYNGKWNEPYILPKVVFKLCTPSQEVSSDCSASDFFSFKCLEWLFAILLVAILIAVLCCAIFCCRSSQKHTDEVCLNFVDNKTGERWYRKGVPKSQPIKLLCLDVAKMMDHPRKFVSLWLQTGKRLRWCYRVGDYGLDDSKDIFVVLRKCNSLCGCCSIEDLFMCIPKPSFIDAPIEDSSRNLSRYSQSTRLIEPSWQLPNTTQVAMY